MRVALFGGSFDPPHLGHVAVARAAADRFALDTVFFAPAGRQPLKPDSAGAGYDDRLMMTALACGEDGRFAVSNLDAPRPDGQPNYTVRTLELLAELLPEATLFNLVGADTFAGLAKWREAERLLALAEWIVVSRPGFRLADPEGMVLAAEQRARLHLLDSVHEEVSATALRGRLSAGELCGDMLPAPVAAYIRKRGLYGAGAAGGGGNGKRIG